LGDDKGLSHSDAAAGERDGRRQARYLAEAAHDLRQPLQALQFMIQTLARQSQDSDTAVLVRGMQGAADCLTDMFETVAELCRLEGGLRQPVRTAIAIGPLCARALDAVRQSDVAGVGRLAVSFADAIVWSDEVLLAKLVINLLLNAAAGSAEAVLDVAGSCRESTYELRISAACMSTATALRHRAFIELKSSNACRPVPTQALGLATLDRYAQCLGHPLDVRFGEDHRLVLTLVLPLAETGERRSRPGPTRGQTR
jgi:two-component system, sensor histidine kinase